MGQASKERSFLLKSPIMKRVEAQGDLVAAREDQEAEEVFVHRVEALREIVQQKEAVQKEDQDLIDQEGIEDVNSIQV